MKLSKRIKCLVYCIYSYIVFLTVSCCPRIVQLVVGSDYSWSSPELMTMMTVCVSVIEVSRRLDELGICVDFQGESRIHVPNTWCGLSSKLFTNGLLMRCAKIIQRKVLNLNLRIAEPELKLEIVAYSRNTPTSPVLYIVSPGINESHIPTPLYYIKLMQVRVCQCECINERIIVIIIIINDGSYILWCGCGMHREKTRRPWMDWERERM